MISKPNPLQYSLIIIIVVLTACATPIPQYSDNITPTIILSNTPVPQTSTKLHTETLLVPSPTPVLLELQPSILVSGLIDHGQGTGNLDSIYIFESKTDIPAPGIYVLRFEDDASQEIASYNFDAGFSYDSSGLGSFVMVLPWNSNTTRIVLLNGEVELDSRSASKNIPEVTVTSPNGGEILNGSKRVVSWSAQDADGDPLQYVVQYSVDKGLHWQTMAVDYPETKLDLDLSFVPNTEAGLVRILASDGFYTSQDESDGVFVVATEKPVYVDIQGGDEAVYSGDQTVILEGEAYTNFGQLSEDSLVWSSDLDGLLGEGADLVVNAQELSEGMHHITLTAHNDEMQSGSDTITVRIYRDFSSLSFDSTPLKFVAKVGDTKTMEQFIEVWHLGNHSITWSANADQNWIVLQSVGNETPSNLIVSTNPTGLPVGTYSGLITITSNAEGIKIQTVTVNLEVKK